MLQPLKKDLPNSNLFLTMGNDDCRYRLDGFKSTKKGWRIFQFDSEVEKKDSIQKGLSRKLFT